MNKMLTFEIPEELAREALQATDSVAEAEGYIERQVSEIKLEWPAELDPTEPSGDHSNAGASTN